MPPYVGTDLANPFEENEHVGVDEEDMYSDDSDISEDEEYVPCKDPNFVPDDMEKSSDDDISEDEDDEIKDAEPVDIPDFSYDRENPPMTEGMIYSDMHEFRVAISQHAIAREFDFKIDKTDPSRFRAHCCDENCKWRIHAPRMDEGSIKVVVNKHGHTCSSTRQDETSKHANQNWVADRVKVWLHEDSSLGPIALQTKIKEKYHMTVPYKRVYNGKEQALEELYGSWDQSFDKLCSYKAEIDKSCPGSSFVIDHEVSLGARRFTKLFFALKPCIDGFLAGCRPYLAIDSTFLTEKFKGQLAAAVAVDGHNWMYPLASGEQKGKSKKSAL